jgi:hypothetical protein
MKRYHIVVDGETVATTDRLSLALQIADDVGGWILDNQTGAEVI